MSKLTEKQKRFISEYLIDSNATQAAIRSGYSANAAKEIGYQLLTKLHIKEKIKQGLEEIQKEQESRFRLVVTDAIDGLVDVLKNGKGVAKVMAANSVLDRANFRLGQVNQQNNDASNDKADEAEIMGKFDRFVNKVTVPSDDKNFN